MLEHLQKADPNLLSTLPVEAVSEIRNEFARIEPRFRTKDGRLRTSWCMKSIAARAQEVEMISHYRTFYSWASSMHHVDIGAVVFQADGNDADVAPSRNWIDTALITGHMSVLRTLGVYNEVAGLGLEDKIQTAMKAFARAWPDSNK